MTIRDALSSVPAKPIIASALVFTVIAASWHGFNVRRTCIHRATLTQQLQNWANSVPTNHSVRLDKAMDSGWDEMRIFPQATKPSASQNCPFGWHWNNDTRQEMVNRGHLGLMGFFKNNRLIEIIDFDNQKVRFEIGETPLPHANAFFKKNANQKLVWAQGPE